MGAIVHDLAPINRRLSSRRHELQSQIDEIHRAHAGCPDPADYRVLLERIGYLVPEPEDFQISTVDVDPEIASIAGPQLVVPL